MQRVVCNIPTHKALRETMHVLIDYLKHFVIKHNLEEH